MAQDNQNQDQQNPLNNAVEHNATPDSNTDEHRAQDRQNQQNTMASTTATGADAAEQNDQVNSPSNQPGADNGEDAGGQPVVEGSDSESGEQSQGQSAGNGDEQSAEPEQQEGGGVDGGGAPQAVGGGAQRSASPRQDEGQGRAEQNGQEQAQGSGGSGSSGGGVSGQGGGQTPFDTETTSETFQVDVADATTKEMVVDGDFDTETVSETFEIQVNNVNDEVVIDSQEQLAFEANEDGRIVITEAQLLINASDIDGDDLSVLNLSIANASFETQVDPETGERSFVIYPDDNINGELAISFDVTDGQGSEVASSALLNVAAVNDEVDIDTSSPLAFDTQEDNQIVITEEQLLANASDVDGDDLSVFNLNISNATFTTQVDPETGDKSFLITPNQDVNGDLAITFDVSDGQGSEVPSSATLQVEAVNDAVIASDDGASNPTISTFSTFSASPATAQQNPEIHVDEDGQLVLRPEDLLANDTDVDGDTLTITEVTATADTHGTVELDESGNVVFIPEPNYHGSAAFEYTVTDGNGTFDTATVTVDVQSVNDEVVAADDDRLNGLEPQIRLDAEPEYGSVQYLDSEGEWVDMQVGQEYPADTQMQFVPDTEDIQGGTRDIQVGSFDGDTSTTTFDGTARVEDWGTVDGDTAVYQEDGVTVTTQVNTGQLAAWNGSGSHVGAGIGNESREGLDTNEMLTVTIEGEEVNQITFQLDGLGSYFDENSSHATEVIIKAYDGQGNLIDSQGGYRDSGEYQDTYVFTTDTPVHHFTLGTTGSDGTYVVQNMTISRTVPEELQVTTIQADGSEVTNTLQLALNHNTADESLNITEQLIAIDGDIQSRPIEVEEDGQLVLNPQDLLGNDTDADGDTLTITEVAATDDTHGSVELDESGNVVFTPAADYNGPASFEYTVTDGNGSFDTATVSVDVTPQNDAAVVGDTSIDGTEDTAITFTQDMLLQNATDVDSDTLTAINLQIDPQYGALTDNQDGTFTFTPKDDFNGEVPFTFDVDDNDGAVTPASGMLDVAAVNDVPVFAETSYTIAEDGSITISEASLLANVTDVDNDDLCVTDISVEGNGTVTRDDETGDWTFTPDADYSGDATLKITVNDTKIDAVFNAPVTITPEADEPSLTVSLTDMSLIDFGLGQETALTGWHTDNANNHIEIHQDYVYGVGDNRGGVIELEANRGDESNLYTNLDVKAGEVVTLEFDMSARKGWEGEDSQVDIYFEGQLIDSLAPDEIGWNHYSYQFTATTDNPKLEFDSPDDNSLGGILDSITVVKEVTEDLPTPVNIDAALSDTDGSESLASLVVDDLPDGAILTDGDNRFTADGDDNSVDINDWDLSLLTFQGGENFHGPVSLTVTATAIEDATADSDTPETASTTATLDFNVVPVNDAVVIDANSPLQFNTDEDTSLVITEAALLANASDVDGDDLSVVNLNIANASFTTVVDPETGDKSYVVTPDQDVNGDLAVSFDVTDGEGSQVASGATLEVAAVNDAVVAEDDRSLPDGDSPGIATFSAFSVADEPSPIEVEEDGQLVISPSDLLANDTDVDGDTLTITEVAATDDTHGSVELDESGNVVFTPDADYNGPASFEYTVTDGNGTFDTATVSVDVTAVNDAAVAGDTSIDGTEDTAITFTQDMLLQNATDVDSDTLTAINLQIDSQYGALKDNEDGTFTFTPKDDFNGEVPFTFEVDDNDGAVTPASGSISVEAVADAPELSVTDGEGNVLENNILDTDPDDAITLNIAASLTDQDLSETLSVTIDGVPEGGVIQYDGQAVLDAQDNGLTSYVDTEVTVTFAGEGAGFKNSVGYYRIDEEGNISDVDLVYENASQVRGGGDLLPGESSFSFELEQGESFNIFVIPNGFHKNDFDGLGEGVFEFRDQEGNPASMSSTDPQLVFVGDDGSETIIRSQFGDAIFHGGSSENLNQDNFQHTHTTLNDDGQIVYGIEDWLGGGDCDYDDFMFTIDMGEENSNIFRGEILSDGETPIVLPSVAIEEAIQLQLPEDFNDEFDLVVEATSIERSNNDEATTTQTIHVDAREFAPEVTGPAAASIDEDTTITITQDDLLANASDADGDALVAQNVTTNHPDVVIVDNGNGSFDITPPQDFHGDISLSFEITDGEFTTPTQMMLTVDPVNDAVVAQDDSTLPSGEGPAIATFGAPSSIDSNAIEVEEDDQLVISPSDLLANDTDVDGDTLTITEVAATDDTHGSVELDESGNVVFTPAPDYNGPASFEYTVTDGNGSFDTATVSVDVTAVNDATVVGDTSIDGTEDTAITFTQDMLLQNATDVDSDTLTAINLQIDPQYGALKDNEDGTFTFTPKDDFNGEVPFTFEVDDNDGAVTPASGTLDVAAVNDVPVFAETSYTIAEDGSITMTEASLLANVSDVDNDVLSVTDISVEGNGTVTRDDETGEWTFTPDADYSGDAELKITVNDTKVDAVFNAPVTITPEADEPSLTVSLTDMSLIDFGLGQDTALTGWHTDNANNHIEIHQDYVYGVGDNRGGVIELEANRGDESNLYTNLDVKAGEVVTLEFDMSARKGWEGEDSQVDIYFEGQLIDSLAPDEIGWNHHSYQFTTTTDNPKLEFDSPDDNSLGGILDSITVVKEVTEDLPTPLNIDAALSDTDGSESLVSLVVDGLPDGAVLTDGDNRFIADGDDNSVDINDWDLSLLTFQGGENFHGPVSLKVTATAIEDATADNDTPETASTTATLDFNVVPVNDAVVIDANSPLQFNTDEDTQIVITEAALLANASDVDGDDLSVVNLNIANATFTTVVDPETGDKSYLVTPDQDVNGDLAISFDVTDGEGSQVASGATLQVAAVNDGPEVSANLAYTIDEDGTITLSQEQLLANASDVDGDKLTAENLQLDADGTVERNEDGSFTITPDENFNGELNLTFDVTDGQETVATGLDLTVNSVNDEVIAADDSRMSAQEPQIRLEAAPEHGMVQCMNADGEWEDMVVGQEYPADAQVQFVPDTDDVQAGTRDIMVGSFDNDTSTTVFDGTASVDDWGTVDGNKAVYQEDGVTITTEVSKGDLAAWNGAGTAMGAGIGNDSRNGLSDDEILTVTVEGEDVNQITFQLDGLGGYFDETSSKATEVIIKAYDADGNLIDAQGGFRESGELQDTYAFTTDVPVHSFSLGTEGGKGTYVVQNMTVSRTMSDEIQMTTIQADGTEDTNTLALDLNHNKADEPMDVTEQLVDIQQGITSRAIEVEEDGQLVIAPSDLLANDTDADGDVLTITAVEATDDTHGTVELDEDGNVVFTPDPDYNGPASFTYTVTDGNGSFDTATVSVDVKPVEDLPQAPTLTFDVNEDQILEIDPAFILSQASDADGDKLSLESLSLKQPPTGNLQLQQDGMYHLITPPDFNGLIELDYAISDGDDVVDGSLKVDVVPVNDAPFNGGNAHLTTYEDGAFTFKAEDMLDLFGDVDGDELVISRVITVEGEEAGDVEQNEDGSWTFTPADDYSGTAELQVEVSDPSGATTAMDVPVYIRPVADGAVITTDHDGPLVFDEDTTGLLGLNVDMLDTSEQLSHLVITGFPVGFVVSDGDNMITITEPGQVIDVTTWSFDDLSLTPPDDFNGSFFITVSATTADYGDEPSNALPEATEAYADFDTAQGETLLLTLDDLLDMAEGVETTDGDSVQGVHLIDRSQGELVDNGDGTWSFTPAEGEAGSVDFAYQVNQGGNLVDVQSSIAVTEAGAQVSVNSAPTVDHIVTTELGSGNELSFTDADMLGQLSDTENDQLSIESVQVLGGQGVLETNNEGQYTFTPAEGFAGQAQIAFIATDGNSSIQSHFNVEVAEPEPSALMMDEMGSLELTQSMLLDALNLGEESTITAVDYHGEQGTVIEDEEGWWVFWSDDDFTGELPLEVTSSDGDTTAVHHLSLDIDKYQDPVSKPEVAESQQGDSQDVDTQATTLEQSDDNQQDGVETDSDITAAPGNTVQLEIPDEATNDPDVLQVEISDLPDGATISNALLNNDGSYTVSGDLSKPVSMTLSDDFEGEATIAFEGQTDMGAAVDGATGTVTIEVDDAYAMQDNQTINANQPAMLDDNGQNGDWTQGDNTNQGVDVMDDSSSFDNDAAGTQQDDSPVMDENI